METPHEFAATQRWTRWRLDFLDSDSYPVSSLQVLRGLETHYLKHIQAADPQTNNQFILLSDISGHFRVDFTKFNSHLKISFANLSS